MKSLEVELQGIQLIEHVLSEGGLILELLLINFCGFEQCLILLTGGGPAACHKRTKAFPADPLFRCESLP